MKQYEGYKALDLEEWNEYVKNSNEPKTEMTSEQLAAINVRNADILVSAAAGSGKTRVLVERIMSRLLNERIDIDRFLIVTFTKAAASEMRERIGRAIDNELEKHEEDDELNDYLSRQAALVHQAHISTIDSFCKDIVKRYFMKISIDPNYRIADEGELTIWKQEALNELLEEYYKREDEAFIHFVECYATGRDDRILEKLILNLYDFQMSHPNPDRWIKEALDNLNDMDEWFARLLEHTREILINVRRSILKAMEFADSNGGGEKAYDALRADLELADSLLDCCKMDSSRKAYDAVYKCLSEHKKFATLYKKEMGEEAGEQLVFLRQKYKDIITKKIKGELFSTDSEKLISDVKYAAPDMEMLLKLSVEFRHVLEEKKREQSAYDFADIEHMALDILTVLNEDGTFSQSDVANSIKSEYKEIMVDEYQDSNRLQEEILRSVSDSNMFMVGDMKQSIYRFRMACPELFVDKYNHFPLYKEGQAEKECRVELDRNFRSSSNVLESINYIFYHLMHKSVGAVEYDKAASLKTGAFYGEPVFEEGKTGEGFFYEHSTEMLIYDEREDSEEEQKEIDKITGEAGMVAERILSLMEEGHHMLVKDDSLEGPVCSRYRPLEFRDIVVLMRSPSSVAAEFQRVFQEAGIPSFIESSKGYFTTPEVQGILSYLKALNNTTEDIAVAGSLRYYFGQISANEMAYIECEVREEGISSLYEKIAYWNGWIEDEQDEDSEDFRRMLKNADEYNIDLHNLKNKVSRFIDRFEFYREKSKELSASDLLQLIYDDSGYYDFINALPAGERRAANLNMLIQKAKDYEKTNFRGLFQFVRYIEQLKEYEVDFGEASLLSENDNVVRLMSIHKSKGLEFPVVFVSMLGKQFNMMDIRENVLLNDRLGLGPRLIDPVLRTRHTTIMREVIKIFTLRDMLGEELRVLYVAMTRAKDKCILTGSIKEFTGALNKAPEECSYSNVLSAKCYLDWILMALVHHSSFKPLCQMAGRDFFIDEGQYNKADFSISVFREQQVKERLLSHLLEQGIKKEMIEDSIPDVSDDVIGELEQKLLWEYPWEWQSGQVMKYSVSQIKQNNIHLSDTLNKEQYDVSDVLPRFIKASKDVSGAERGTLVHRFMELYDFTKGFSMEEYDRVAMQMEQRAYKNVRGLFPVSLLESFFKTGLAEEMSEAARRGQLYKEAQFVVGFPAEKVLRDMDIPITSDDGEHILVQGIIDGYYVNLNGNIVIMDYKTDRVEDMEHLKSRYEKQLEYYKDTIEQITENRVERMVLYSFYTGKTVDV